MTIASSTPCDFDGICPYNAQYSRDCEFWCSADEPEDIPLEYTEDDEIYYCEYYAERNWETEP